jgi:hypothetical protein
MPCNLPVSNKRDLKENSCISFGCGSFTITGGSGGIEEDSITNPARRRSFEAQRIELFEKLKVQSLNCVVCVCLFEETDCVWKEVTEN